jgi:hypothetical protein
MMAQSDRASFLFILFRDGLPGLNFLAISIHGDNHGEKVFLFESLFL